MNLFVIPTTTTKNNFKKAKNLIKEKYLINPKEGINKGKRGIKKIKKIRQIEKKLKNGKAKSNHINICIQCVRVCVCV